jgi:hypothetical protein
LGLAAWSVYGSGMKKRGEGLGSGVKLKLFTLIYLDCPEKVGLWWDNQLVSDDLSSGRSV